jgi:hypothetical protein
VERSKPDVEVAKIEQRILLVRGERVIIDADLAEFYGVPTKRLNEQVTRNELRFPVDFVFRLTKEEKSELVAKCDRFGNLKHSTVLPRVFTEHGALMAATVLKSSRAVEVSLFVVRAFVKLRQVIEQHRELARRLTQLENRLAEHDGQILALVRAIKQLARPDSIPPKRRIGFGEK